MFVLGSMIIIAWVFCFFYYGDAIPRNINIAMVIAGLFTMGWGLLAGKR
jgi:hypothetical protein